MKDGRTILIPTLCFNYADNRLESIETCGEMYIRVHAVESVHVENAKLRELCRGFAEYVSHDRCDGCVCKGRCNDGKIEECWQRTEIREIAHELGIEVDGC